MPFFASSIKLAFHDKIQESINQITKITNILMNSLSEALASSASSEGRAYKYVMENVSLCLSNSSNRHLGVHHSTFESLRLGRSSQSIASGFLASGIP
ncbi:hypothetical protein YC2023_059105 [Brassica napus]